MLLLASAIWGFAFVAQRAGMEHVGPFVFNTARFVLGAATLLVLRALAGRRRFGNGDVWGWRRSLQGGALAGVVLFLGASLQQAGIVTTSAGKAGFITGLYVVIVPFLGFFWGHRPRPGSWFGAILAALGLYLLSVGPDFRIESGDGLVLAAAFFWAIHILIVARLSRVMSPLRLSFLQFAVAALASAAVALFHESTSREALSRVAIPILYSGILSAGVAFTLQILAQRDAHPAHAAILLSFEGVFAGLGGWMLLGETLSARGMAGCALMLAGALLSQILGSTRQRRAVAVFVTALAFTSCSKRSEEGVVWSTGTAGRAVAGAYTSGDVALRGGTTWIAYAEEVNGVSRVRIRRAEAETPRASRGEPLLATFEGEVPGLGVRTDGGLLVVYRHHDAIWSRRGAPDGRSWDVPVPVSPYPSGLASGRLPHLRAREWIVPVVHEGAVVCARTADDGVTWRVVGTLEGAASDAAIAVSNGLLHMVLRQGSSLWLATSGDDGATWSDAVPLGIVTRATSHALESTPHGLALAWTDAALDSGAAPPPVRALRLATSANSGTTWDLRAPIAWRAGREPVSPALAAEGERLVCLFEDRWRNTSTLACVAVGLDDDRASGEGRYRASPGAAREALRLWTEHTLLRPETSIRLFIEGYFMRALVVAHEVLAPLRAERADALDTREGILRAVTFADWMLAGQDSSGYWPLGYKAVYVADMAAVVGLFASLEPHVEPERLRRYTESASRFAAALQRDRMLLPEGAVGVGWPATRTPGEASADRTPYLVSTALAGIETHAWLYKRTRNAIYRDRAIAALDYTLAQLRPEGSLPGFALDGEAPEGNFLVAAYVQEGWMAADLFLEDAALHERLRVALRPHVAWLLRSQRPDGTWDSGADGEYARTPAIVGFLIWYDARCEAREDVRDAVRKASRILLDPDRWMDYGILRQGKHEEVLRAIAGRPIAALAADGFVF